MTVEKKRERIIEFLYIACIGVIFLIFLRYFLPVLTPFVFGFLIATSLRGLIGWTHRKTKIPYSLAAVIYVILFYLIFVFIISLAGLSIFQYIRDFFIGFPDLYRDTLYPSFMNLINMALAEIKDLNPDIYDMLANFNTEIFDQLGTFVTNSSLNVVRWTTERANSLPGLFLGLLMTVITSFFFALDYDKIIQFFLAQFNEKNRNLIISGKDYLVHVLKKYAKSYLIIMTITFTELSIGLSLIGIKNPAIVALLIAIFDILPVAGTGGIMIPWAIFSLVTGNTLLAIQLMVIYIIITVIRNIIEPKIISNEIGLHPLILLACMFLGVRWFGALGLFGLPITIAILKGLHDQGKIKLYRPVKHEKEA